MKVKYNYLNGFVEYKKMINIEDKTIYDYVFRISRFIDWVKSNKSLNNHTKLDINDINLFKDIKRRDVSDYIVEFKSQNSMSTTQKERTSIQQWFKYLMDRLDMIEYNPAIGIEIPRDKIKKQQKLMTIKEGYDLIDNVRDIKSKLAIGFMLYEGMRIEEVSDVKISNINLSNHKLTVIGKGKKERIIPLRSEMESLINKYLDRHDGIKSKDFLFYNPRTKKQYTTNGIRKLFDKECKSNGFDGEQYHPHSLRKLCATELYSKGYSDKLIQMMLGHSNINTTRDIYIAVEEQDLYNAVRGE